MKPVHLISLLALFLMSLTAYAADNDCEAATDCQTETSPGLTANVIEAYEPPDFEQLTVNVERLNDRWYMQVDGAMTIYDAPNGNALRTLDAGFNFITALEETEGWVRINQNEWAPTSHLANSNHIVSRFTGIFIPEDGLTYTPAWLLVNLYPSREPGGDPVESNGLHYRYTLVTIFDEVMVDGYRWYQIGVDQWVHQYHVSKVLPVERPADVTTDKWVSVDLYEQVVIAYEGERAIFATLTATGLPRWPTYEGVFNIYYRRVRDDMSWGTPGDDFYMLEEVPWTMYFDEGRALHGAYWHDGFGYRRSHGCVNLSITDAYWLYNWVAEDFEKFNSPDIEEGPNVYVYSSDEYLD